MGLDGRLSRKQIDGIVLRLSSGLPVLSGLPVSVSVNVDQGALESYCISLRRKMNVNKGLSHGKVREYWLYRAPRQAAMAVVCAFSFFFCTCCESIYILGYES